MRRCSLKIAVVGAKAPMPRVSKKSVTKPVARSVRRQARSAPRPRSRNHQRPRNAMPTPATTPSSMYTPFMAGIAAVDQSPRPRSNASRAPPVRVPQTPGDSADLNVAARPRIRRRQSAEQGEGMTQGTHHATDDPRNRDIHIYVNGELRPRAQAVVSVFDSGFILGDGVWEGLRVHRGRIAFLGAHLDRLSA